MNEGRGQAIPGSYSEMQGEKEQHHHHISQDAPLLSGINSPPPRLSPVSRRRTHTTATRRCCDSLIRDKIGTRTRIFGLPVLVAISLFMMVTFTWIAYVLLFLVPSLSTTGEATVVSSDNSQSSSSALGNFALQKVLADSTEVFGLPENNNNNGAVSPPPPPPKDTSPTPQKTHHRSSWMSLLPDSTPLTHLNIPGTHDSATWNFTQARSDSIRHNTDPSNAVYPAAVYRCQRLSLLASLNAGIRFFDLRYGLDPSGVRLVFYHAHALMSPLSTLDDVLYAFYSWLDAHPSETVLLSIKIEDTGINTDPADALHAQALLLQSLANPAARRYILQTPSLLGTLGPARGKIILLRRFDIPEPLLSPSENQNGLPGLYLPPSRWLVNSRAPFRLTYNPARNLSVQIEDYYEPGDLPQGAGASTAEIIAAKVDAVRTNLVAAAAGSSQSGGSSKGDGEDGTLFITFTSAELNVHVPAVTPRIMALGNGSEVTPLGGVNRQVVRGILPGLKGKRVGVVVIDFWDWDKEEDGDGGVDVVGAILDL